jgi:hypothetical protein
VPSLVSLDIRETEVTEPGVNDLKRSLPNLKVLHSRRAQSAPPLEESPF